MRKKLNCWEYTKCGREPGGREEYVQGPCPAATFRQFDGIYGGTNAGRSCWLAAQTDTTEKTSGRTAGTAIFSSM